MKIVNVRNSWWNLSGSGPGANLKCNVLSNGLDPVGDELVDDVPWIVGPLGYTVCMYVCVCVRVCAHDVDA